MVPAIALTGLLALAAWRDVLTRIIPDRIVLIVAAIGIAVRAAAGWSPLLLSAATAAAVFVVLLAFAMRGWLGGGDVKLAAAVALDLPPAATWDFLFITIQAGGLLGLVYVASRRLAPSPSPATAARTSPAACTLPARFRAVEARRLRRGGPLPYGVAIAAGGILVLLAGI